MTNPQPGAVRISTNRPKPRARHTSSVRPLDDLDWQIIERLRADGRYQNKELARLLQVSEPTIASRIKRLRVDRVMVVTVQQDIYHQGFDLQCLAHVSIGNRDVEAVGRDLATLPNVTVVTLLLGSPEVMIVFNAHDRADMIDMINRQISRIRGIDGIETEIALRITKYESSFANLANPYADDQGERTAPPDDLDQNIIAALQPDGRLSNREIARQLDVSETTVRQRLKRMQDANHIRVGVVVDAVKTGFPASAWVRVSVAPKYLDEAVRTFAALPEITYVGETTGTYNVLLVMFARTDHALLGLANSAVRTCKGVGRFEIRVMAQTVKHNYFEVAISNGRVHS